MQELILTVNTFIKIIYSHVTYDSSFCIIFFSQEKKGLVRPLPFKPIVRCKNNSNFTTTGSKSNPVNNLNQQHSSSSKLLHQPSEESSSSIMCNRIVASDLRHKLSDRISCMSPFFTHSPSIVGDESTVEGPHDSSHQLMSSSSKIGTILPSNNFTIKQQQQQQKQHTLVDESSIHHSPLTYVMNSTCSSSGIGDSSSSSTQSFTTQSQCSISQSSYLLDDDATTWYSPSFDPHQHHHHHKQHSQQNEKVHSNVKNSNNSNSNNNNNHNHNGNNPVLPPKPHSLIFSPSSQRHKTVQRSSTFNSDDLTMQSTPSPCSDNDTGHVMTMNELESLVREKDAQISYLRETLEQNEQVCCIFLFSPFFIHSLSLSFSLYTLV